MDASLPTLAAAPAAAASISRDAFAEEVAKLTLQTMLADATYQDMVKQHRRWALEAYLTPQMIGHWLAEDAVGGEGCVCNTVSMMAVVVAAVLEGAKAVSELSALLNQRKKDTGHCAGLGVEYIKLNAPLIATRLASMLPSTS